MATQTPLSISSVTYEDLADLEADFIDFDTDLRAYKTSLPTELLC